MSSPLVIEPFDRLRHDRSAFDCGDASLNDWLATRISQFEKKDLARTYVLVDRNHLRVEGYYSISTHSVKADVLPAEQAKGLPRLDIPVVLFGRLAVNQTLQGKGYGEILLLDALSRSEYLSNTIGIRAVEVHAASDGAKQFYQRFGFLELLDDPRHLFLPMQVIRRLRLPPI